MENSNSSDGSSFDSFEGSSFDTNYDDYSSDNDLPATGEPILEDNNTEEVKAIDDSPDVSSVDSSSSGGEVTLSIDQLQQLSELSPDYDSIHNNLMEMEEYRQAIDLIKSEDALDRRLSEVDDTYKSLESSLDKEHYRNAVLESLKANIAGVLDSQGKDYLEQSKVNLFNDIALSNFQNALSSNSDEFSPLTSLSDNLYRHILSEKNFEDSPESRDIFNKTMNSFVISMGNVFGLEPVSFGRALSKFMGGGLPKSSSVGDFNSKKDFIEKARQKSKSITGMGVESQSVLSNGDEDDWLTY